ncbi:MAG: hypothetical protein ACKO28_08605 [Cyanobium sp.]
MTVRRLLVLPLLSPLLAVLLVAALNPSPQLSFRLLTWQSPRAPLGLWLGGAALAGAALSGAGTALALRQGQGTSPIPGRRQVRTPFSRAWAQGGVQEDGEWQAFADRPTPPWREQAPKASRQARGSGEERLSRSRREDPVAVAPPRSPGDPAPTVDVPFRILHRPAASRPEHAPSTPLGGRDRSVRAPEPMPVGGGEDDWGKEGQGDDW